MENGWNLFNFNNTTTTNFGRVHNSSTNCTTTTAWDISESGTSSTSSRIDWSTCINPHNSFSSSASTTTVTATATHEKNAAEIHALMVSHEGNSQHVQYCNTSDPSRFYGAGGGGGSHYFPDPHLMCLKLGKRHYFGDTIATPFGEHQAATPYSMTKKGKPYCDAGGDTTGFLEPSTSTGVTMAPSTAVPRCQVDGCNVVLLNAKDYHRRHKVCEIHSKAPKVLVLGLEQRFCQQCSRFHAVSEFDESKRSCRRRLAGHNERRRKSSQEHSGIRNQSQVNTRLMTYPGRHAYLPLNSACALSLLSPKYDSWISATDLPTRCSAALRELIAENRAAILARQLILDKDLHWHHHPPEEDLNGRQSGSNSILNYQQQMATGSHNWERMGEAEAHVTLDLMQAPNSAFGFLPMRGKSKEDDHECPELWSSYGGAHVV